MMCEGCLICCGRRENGLRGKDRKINGEEIGYVHVCGHFRAHHLIDVDEQPSRDGPESFGDDGGMESKGDGAEYRRIGLESLGHLRPAAR